MNTLPFSVARLDNSCLGESLMLREVKPLYKYESGEPTDKLIGYKYVIMLPERGFLPFTIKILGEKQMDVRPGHVINVEFDNLLIHPYVDKFGKSPKQAYSAEATGIRRVGSKD